MKTEDRADEARQAAGVPFLRRDGPAGSGWRPLYRIGAYAAAAVLALIPVQAAIYVVWPPPTTVAGWFALYERAPLVGLLNFDLLYLVSNVLMAPIHLALYAALRRVAPGLMALALAFGLVGLAAYLPTNGAFEMLALSRRFAAAPSEAERLASLAAGQAVVASFTGSAYLASYLLDAVAILVVAGVMLRGGPFGRWTAYAGIGAGVLMLVPSTAGALGLATAFLSLFPTAAWLALVARTLYRLEPGHVPDDRGRPPHTHGGRAGALRHAAQAAPEPQAPRRAPGD